MVAHKTTAVFFAVCVNNSNVLAEKYFKTLFWRIKIFTVSSTLTEQLFVVKLEFWLCLSTFPNSISTDNLFYKANF